MIILVILIILAIVFFYCYCKGDSTQENFRFYPRYSRYSRKWLYNPRYAYYPNCLDTVTGGLRCYRSPIFPYTGWPWAWW